MNKNKYYRLQELDHSNFEIVKGEPDIRGWDVRYKNGEKIGSIEELILDTKAKKGSSSGWLWILISIIVIAAVAFILIWNNRDNTQESPGSKPNQTSYIQYHSLRAA